jgi:Trk K+ transport system NAD-binding subunit
MEESPSAVAAPEGQPSSDLYVITGLSRLSVRVSQSLVDQGHRVTIVGREEAEGLRGALDKRVQVVAPGSELANTLEEAGLKEARCLLALGDDDLQNLAATVAANALAPDVAVVLRSFDAGLSDQLENSLSIRRAFSVASLTGPMFVVAALGAEPVETMRLGDIILPIARIEVSPGSRLEGQTASQVKSSLGCALLGHAGPREDWQASTGDRHTLKAGDRIVIGGRTDEVLQVVRDNSPFVGKRGGRGKRPRRQKVEEPRRTLSSSFLPISAIGFLALVVLTMAVFAIALHKNPIDAMYSAVLAAFGSPDVAESDPWLKAFAVGAMIVGGALLGILIAWVTAFATAERLESQMGRKARHLHGHIVLAGLGSVGYQIERRLFALRIPVAVVEKAPDQRFLGTVGQRTPVLTGDVRLSENLQRAAIRNAVCFVACTNDDLTNLEACLQARRLMPGIRTVARIFDEMLADRAAQAFHIDVVLSTTQIATSAFLGAAADERSVRRFKLDGVDYLGLRYRVRRSIPFEELERWREDGIRVLAFRHGETGEVLPPSELRLPMAPGDSAVVAGPAEAIRRTVLDD